MKADLQFLPPGETVSLEKIAEKLRLQVPQIEDLIREILNEDPSIGFLNVFKGLFIRKTSEADLSESFDYNELAQLEENDLNLILEADSQLDPLFGDQFMDLAGQMTANDKETIAQIAQLVGELKKEGKKIGNDDFFRRMGVVSLMNGQVSESEIFFDELWQADPDQSKWVHIGIELQNQQLFAEAEEAFRVALQFNLSDGDAWYYLASNLLEQRNYEEAEMAFEKAIAHMPNDGRVWGSLGELLLELARLDEAEEVFRSALMFNPNLASIWKSLGSLLYARGNYEEAEQAYKNAIDLHPHEMEFWERIGDVYNQMDKFEQAEIAYQQAINLTPNDHDIQYKLGLMHYKQKLYKDAFLIWNKTLQETKPDWIYRDEVRRMIKIMQERLLI